MVSTSPLIFDRSRCHLGEGPSYDPGTDTAWWVDILEKCLFEKSLGAGDGPARRHTLPFMASDVAAIDADRHLISGDDGLYIRTIADGRLHLSCPLEADDTGTRSNDGRVHPSGALWISTMGRDAQTGRGTIYHVAGTRITRLYGNLTIPNGISFSPDGAVGYFVDSKAGLLQQVALDPATGLPIGEPRTLYDHSGGEGDIDGAAVDSTGLVWTARFGAGCLDAYTPAGDRVRTVPVPVRRPTCPTFVGRNLDRLLVTSAYEGLDDDDRAADPEHGHTLLIDVGVTGLLEPRFRLDG